MKGKIRQNQNTIILHGKGKTNQRGKIDRGHMSQQIIHVCSLCFILF